ncbi:MAG: response regulator [Anaerolineae bacterium]|nr:response regulator [Anaerolineae bacterium]
MSLPLALIIDDEIMLAEIFSVAVKMAGFDTETIHDGQTAIERLAEITPALVLLDLHLPGVPGPDILRRIRADERLAHTRVLIISADGPKAESLRDEADEILTKPLGVAALRDVAARYLPSEDS